MHPFRFFAALAGVLFLSLCAERAVPVFAAPPALPLLHNVTTDKARYAPGEPVTISVALTNPTKTRNTVRIGGAAWHLQTPVAELVSQTVVLAPGATKTIPMVWMPPKTDFQGYRVAVWAKDEKGRLVASGATAVDVSSRWTRFPRYGFLSTFPNQSAPVSQTVIRHLIDYHINALQFYDWQYKHHRPLAGTVAAPAASWPDLANRPTYRQTVLDTIQFGHKANIAAMNYNLLYGATQGYEAEGVSPEWGLFFDQNHTKPYELPLPSSWASSSLTLFNPANTNWQNTLFQAEKDVFAAYPFDGWHIDSVGGPPQPVFTYDGKPVDVWPTFRPFLNNAKANLQKTIVFNNVGGYGLYDTAARADVDALYVECWPFAGQKTYADLKTLIDNCVTWSGGKKSVVLPAYMNYEHAQKFSDEKPGAFNLPGVLLTDAVIFASGASHLELGDNLNLLDSEYFPNRHLATPAPLKAALRNYYDFLVANENVLQGGLINQPRAVISTNTETSADAKPGTIWAFAKADALGRRHVLHLINLRNQRRTEWRDDAADYPTPPTESSLTVKYYTQTGLKDAALAVWWASPDFERGKMASLPATRGSDAQGPFIEFTLPKLVYWDMVLIEHKPVK